MISREVKIEPYLWTSEARADGTFAITLRLTHYKSVKYLPTSMGSSVENWDDINKLPRSTHPKAKDISRKLKELEEDAKFVMRLAESQNEDITIADVKARVQKKNRSKGKAPKIFEFFDIIIEKYEKENNPGYADVFEGCKHKLSNYLNGQDKAFVAFNKADAEGYESFIKSTHPTDSTISYYLRGFFRIWNLAEKEGYVEKGRHPKQHISFKAYKRIKRKRKAIKIDFLTKMMQLQFEYGTRRWKNLEYLKFMYYTRGMNWGDMCRLKRKQVADWLLEYKRQKNKRDYSFEMHPKAIAIVKLFEQFPEQSDDDYVFPILMEKHDTARKIDQRIESSLQDFNEDMKFFAKEVGMQRKPSSNALRHSFASHVRDKGVDIALVQEAMGHETEQQLREYLAEIDDSEVSNAINEALE